ncbi:leucyl aminopeptidase [Anaerosinus massiliensis]|uniref:leucyl aminopeptidase n=1 Tax=Massilibacillus massiliensis TaxID=1806837 RepID=UPI0018FE7F3D|nr:leucyl aminopeptidase [Massilibacillus massiliensis]
MMSVEVRSAIEDAFAQDVLLIQVFKNSLLDEEAVSSNLFSGLMKEQIRPFLVQYPDAVNYGEIHVLHMLETRQVKSVILIGAGEQSEMTSDKLRNLFGKAMGSVKKTKAKSLGIYVNFNYNFAYETALQAAFEGVILGSYQFEFYKTIKKDAVLGQVIFCELDEKKVDVATRVLNKTLVITDSVCHCRDLVNHPSCTVTPTYMAKEAERLAHFDNFTVEIMELAAIKDLNMGAFLAVAKGSNELPKFIVIKYTGNRESNECVAYIGKGITFDSGGISLKPSANMGDMKDDMAGAAAVLTTMRAIAQLQPKANVLALIPCCENMPSGHATKPGDVIKSMSGITIEVDNTDAEGRLILADAVHYATVLGATKIIDIATLTGACVVALGDVASGVVSNDTKLCSALLKAAKTTGEKMWQLPNYEEYKEQFKSDIADLKNTGGRNAGTITAAMFIEAFTKGVPWVHIDIAGTANLKKANGYQVKGASGVATRTLIQFALEMGK